MKSNIDDDSKASIIDEVDLEFELIRRDNINVAHILALLASIASGGDGDDAAIETAAKKKAILNLLGTEARLRSKRERIEEFIASCLPNLSNEEETKEVFWGFWNKKRSEAFDEICNEEDLNPEGLASLLGSYQFSDKEPLTDENMQIMETPRGIPRRKTVAVRIVSRMVDYIETFDEAMGDLEAA